MQTLHPLSVSPGFMRAKKLELCNRISLRQDVVQLQYRFLFRLWKNRHPTDFLNESERLNCSESAKCRLCLSKPSFRIRHQLCSAFPMFTYIS